MDHTVVPNDCLSTIAAGHNIPDWRTVWAANPTIANPDLIHPGQIVKVPTIR